MANFGSFAGALAQSGMSTYQQMTAIQKARKEQEQADQADKLLAQASQQVGTGGQDVQSALGNLNQPDVGNAENTMTPEGRAGLAASLKDLTPEQQTAALRAYGAAYGNQNTPEGQASGLDLSKATVYQGPKGAMATNEMRAPTEQEKASRFQALAGAAGNRAAYKEALTNSAALQGLEKGGYELSGLKRQAETQKKWDTFADDSMAVVKRLGTMAHSNDAGQVVKEFGADVEKATGEKMSVDPKTNQVVITFPDGKVQKMDAQQSMKMIHDAVMGTMASQSMMMLGDAKSFSDALNKKAEADAKVMDAQTHRLYYGPGGVWQQVENAAISQRGAGAGEKSIKARASEYADAMVQAGTINPATKKPYTPEEATKYALSVALKDPNAKAQSEWKVSTDGSFRSNAEGVVQDFNPKTNQWQTRGLPQVSANAAKLGVTADVGKNGQAAFQGKDGWYSTEQEAVGSFSAPSAIRTNAPASAIPEQKFIRHKSQRGGFTYEASPRGQTRAQWSALDAAQ